ncbi:unnamed protein product [Parnassius apollo]|uniref:(apollo) hypothetical protein n=1 Tax=Parnassius apollo TaxID=110799 RepID=A0A8S3XR36_PARAO|nr:unnamed protein product [Parnassius apollo]
MNDLYNKLITTYVQKTHIMESDRDKIDPTDEKYFKSSDEMYLGLGSVQNQLLTNEIPCEKKKVKQFEEFSLVAQFMLNILALPNSNAECERVFSQINDTKTKNRNRLITETIKGNMLAKQAICRHDGNCVNFLPTDKMLKPFNSEIYKKWEAIDSNSD